MFRGRRGRERALTAKTRRVLIAIVRAHPTLEQSKTAKPGKATFVFKNIGRVSHDFKINGKRTPLISPGKTANLVVTLKKGRHPYLCTVPGHAAAGMKEVFTVR